MDNKDEIKQSYYYTDIEPTLDNLQIDVCYGFAQMGY